MLFNSWEFLFFFMVVFGLYVLLKHKWQNRMLLVASCVFYGSWNWKFLFLMFASISVDYFCAFKINSTDNQRTRRNLLLLSIIVNLSILGFFKYYNFFISNFQSLLSNFGISTSVPLLNVILPLGISFYTFEAISYVIDVYRKKMEPIKSYRDYALFVTFFPHLIAGPIMRAKDLMPQICFPRTLTYHSFSEGVYLIFWGLFQKMVIADNLAKVVNPVFASDGPYQSTQVLLAIYAFAFQIYCDFAGYSNIARGLGKCMGFDIMLNFNLPYFVTNPRDFWQRWHISLSTWLRDYLYIPLGGSKHGEGNTYKNLAITMLLGGLWHGASWTFVIWGLYQGVLLIIHRALSPILARIPSLNGLLGALWFILRVIFFFHLICLGWLIFRASSMHQVGEMLQAIGKISLGGIVSAVIHTMIAIWFLLTVELIQFYKKDLTIAFKWPWIIQGLFYFLIVFFIITLGAGGAKEFIYFQF